MLRRLRYVLVILAAAALAPAAPAQPHGALELEVDCDRGESLRRALRRAERATTATITVRGTCNGAYVVSSENWIEIVGDPAAGAELRSGSAPVFYVVGPGTLLLRNLRLAGGMGVRAAGGLRLVGLEGCAIESDSLGVFAESDAAVLVLGSDVAALDSAVRVDDAQMLVQESRLHDSTFAARSFGGRLWLEGVEAADNQIGVLAQDRSGLVVVGGRFERNGQGHVGGTADSRLVLYNVQLGGPDDATAVSLSGNGGVAIEVYRDDPAVELWGTALLHDDSFMTLEGATLHGSIAMRGFSRLLLDGTVTGSVGCASAADAWCGRAASAATTGCPSAPPRCEPAPADGAHAPPRRPPPPAPPEALRRLLDGAERPTR